MATNLTARNFFFKAEDGIRVLTVTGVQTCALPIFFVTSSARLRKLHAVPVRAGHSSSGRWCSRRSPVALMGTAARRTGYLPRASMRALAPFPLPLSLLVLAGCVSEHGPLTNRMAQSTTPYLARAARQPVSWQPWGRDAFALAARLDRPILLYVGADDCRWCGVMDREVYGDPGLGAMIDSLFVPVRVDRDERPDVAQRYATAVRLLAGLRGYPITVFLTPDGSAFFGGTYFPLDDPVTGRGLKQLLPDVAKSYREQRASILRRAELVRQLSLGRREGAHGARKASAVQRETEAVRGLTAAAARTHADVASFRVTQAVDLLLAAHARTGDSSYLVRSGERRVGEECRS